LPLQVRRTVLRLLPKVPLLSPGSSSSSSAGGSSLQGAVGEYPRADDAAVASSTQGGAPNGGANDAGIVALLQPVGPCPVCGARDILLPFVALPCRHVFCYYCLRAHCAADAAFACPVDGERVQGLQRLVRRVGGGGDDASGGV
jgi:peroxin-2